MEERQGRHWQVTWANAKPHLSSLHPPFLSQHPLTSVAFTPAGELMVGVFYVSPAADLWSLDMSR